METIIIDVDSTHRIKITKSFNGSRNQWMWEVQKQKYFRFFSFFKNWHSSDWGTDGGLFMTVKSYESEQMAVNEANYIKRQYLKGIESITSQSLN